MSLKPSLLVDHEDFQLAPVGFFSLGTDCFYHSPSSEKLTAAHQLPSTALLCGEEAFAEISIGWGEAGIWFEVAIDKPFEQAAYPDVQAGDSVELFIDTRDLKTAGFNTRFCHHFFFFAQPIEGKTAGEITRFRTEDTHELCEAAHLQVKAHCSRSHHKLAIFIPAQCLHGYAPDQFNRLGFTYRINRFGDAPQHFSVVSRDYQIDQQPSLWSSLRLIK